MEALTKIAWAILAAIHILPALPLVRPQLLERLYGVSPGGDVGLLLTHRSVLFAGVLIAAITALFDLGGRRLASVVLAVSMVGFLILYVRAGAPAGELRRIAFADLAGLAPLAFVCWRAWR